MLMPALRCRWTSDAGSMSPVRVPMTSPSSGVMPIDVSIANRRGPPSGRAVAQVQDDLVEVLEPAAQEARDLLDTYWWDVPWKP